MGEKNILKEKIDINGFGRKEQYCFFSQFEISYYSVTIPVYIKDMVKVEKKYGFSLYGLFAYVLLAANNEVLNFCYRRENDDIYKYNMIDASCTCLKDENLQYSNRIIFKEDLREFMNLFMKKKQEAENGKQFSDLGGNSNIIYLSTLPWFRLKNVTSVRQNIKDDTIPRYSWGKIYGDNEWVDMIIEVSHLFIDGYHISLLINKVKENILKLRELDW